MSSESLDARGYSESVIVLFTSFIHLSYSEIEVKILPGQRTISQIRRKTKKLHYIDMLLEGLG